MNFFTEHRNDNQAQANHSSLPMSSAERGTKVRRSTLDYYDDY